MQCPNCKTPGLDINRAKNSTNHQGVTTRLVSAPCCGAPLQVETRRVVMAEVKIAVVQTGHDDWGVPYDPRWKRHRMCEHCGGVKSHKIECITQGQVTEP
jgi:hypothetical protein